MRTKIDTDFLLRMIVIVMMLNQIVSLSTSNSISGTTITSHIPIAHYNFDGNALDQMGIYNGIPYGPKTSFDRFGSVNSAYLLNGSSDYIDLGAIDIASQDSFTISLWFLPLAPSAPLDSEELDSMDNQYIISSTLWGGSTGVYAAWNKGSILSGHITPSKRSISTYQYYAPAHKWHHLALAVDATNNKVKTYLNGDLVNEKGYEDYPSTEISNNILLGKGSTGNQHFKGKVDDVIIYDSVLDISEITNLYNHNCQDSLSINNLHVEDYTLRHARSSVSIDTLSVDSFSTLHLVCPTTTVLDSSKLNVSSQVTLYNTDGCNQTVSPYEPHFQHRGVYINRFVSDGILANTLKGDSLLNWCTANEFNNIYLYNIGSALSIGMQVELDAFVAKANNAPWHIDVTFVSAGFGTSFSNIESYHDTYTNIPQGIVSEIEFWNGTKTYEDHYEPWINKLNALKYDTPPGMAAPRNSAVVRRFYIGKIKNPGEPPSLEIARQLVTHHDEIFLTNYHTDGYNLSSSTSENAIVNKLKLLASAARELDKKVSIVILFNVRQDSPAPNIWNYFDRTMDNHHFSDAYHSFYEDFLNTADIPHKQYLNFKGYGIYRYSDARVARPE